MADQNFMDLASKTASGITGTDYMMLVNNSEAYKALVNDVAEAILGKLTSKSFSGLETTAKNVIGALNELNSKIEYKIQYKELSVNITTQVENCYTLNSAMDLSDSFPNANKIIAIGGRKPQSNYLCIAAIENNANLYAFSWFPGEYKVLIIAIY